MITFQRGLAFGLDELKWPIISREYFSLDVSFIENFSEQYAVLEGMSLLLMVRTVQLVFLIMEKGKTVYFRYCDIPISDPLIQERYYFLQIARKVWQYRNYLGRCLSRVGFFDLDDLDPPPFSRVAMRDLFLDEEFGQHRLAELGHTDSLVQEAASINCGKGGERQVLYGNVLFLHHTQKSTSILSSTGSQQSKALLRNVFT